MGFFSDDAQLMAMRATNFAHSLGRGGEDRAKDRLMESIMAFILHYADSSDIAAKVVSAAAISGFKSIDMTLDRIDFELLTSTDKKDAYAAIIELMKDIRKITSLFEDIDPNDLH